jgi:uncharacterized metal-binding protein
MPSGVTHDRITLWILPWVTGIGYGLTRSGELSLILAGGFLFSGMMFGPDLDINSIQYKRWGLLKPIWLPYRKFLSHRSILSHGPIIGTCIRLLYLLSITAVASIFAVAIAQLVWGFVWNWQDFVRQRWALLTDRYLQEFIVFSIGLEVGAMSHSFSDWFSSNRKLRLKKRSQTKAVAKKTRRPKIYQKKK